MKTRLGDVQHKKLNEIHLKDYLAVVWKRKSLVILFSVVVTGLVAAVSFRATPVYEATATLIIEHQTYAVTHAEQDLNSDINALGYYQTQCSLLESRSLALKVIKDLDLLKEFQAENPTPPGDQATEGKNGVSGPPASAGRTPAAVQGSPDQALQTEWSDAADWYLANLRVGTVKGSRLIKVGFRSASPEIAATVANAHVRAFIASGTEMKMAASRQKLSWLKQQPRDRHSGSLSLPAASSKDNIFSLPEVAQDPIIQMLRTQLIQLKSKRQELSSNFGPKHPKMVELQAQIGQVEKEISEEARRVSRVVSTSFESSNISVVDEAEIPRAPVGPRRFLNLFLAVMMSMFIGPFLAFFAEYMDRTIKTPEEAERRLGMTVLGVVPVLRSSKKQNSGLLCWEKNRFLGKGKDAYDGDSAVRFIPGLLSIRRQPKGNLLFVASATSEEGKTTVLSNLALSLARRGVSVLVIDTDLVKPALHTAFGVGNGEGLASLLSALLAKNVLTGDLKTWSVDDLFFLIALKRLRGSLTVL